VPSLKEWSWVCLFCSVASISSPAQTFKHLTTFNGPPDGAFPEAALVQGLDGTFHGITDLGGAGIGNCEPGGLGCGTIFKITPGGKRTTLYSFCSLKNCTDGNFANGYVSTAALVLAGDGNFYGATSGGGNQLCFGEGCGTIFQLAREGKLTTIYTFCQTNCADGAVPLAGLVRTTDGNFYGTTSRGGLFNDRLCMQGCGTVFKIIPGGKLTTLYTFCSQRNCADGAQPLAALLQAPNGNFYGSASGGGANNVDCLGYCGTVFKITSTGKLSTLYRFCTKNHCPDGETPVSALVRGVDGNFYGTTQDGGISNQNVCVLGCGTVFRITPAGELTTLYSFCAQTDCADGGEPSTALVHGTDGNFYGTTLVGANPGCIAGCGTAFRITPRGKLTTLYTFCSQTNCADGANPVGLMQATDGKFYGTTFRGGNPNCTSNSYGCGTIYSLSVGLGPFVETNPGSGKVGAKVAILGNKLNGASGVSFNGTPATFTIVSSTEIETTVPVGATTGLVMVTAQKRKLQSNVIFQVLN
jgi:uncharacterized repeat protein (TIGR03803 family)